MTFRDESGFRSARLRHSTDAAGPTGRDASSERKISCYQADGTYATVTFNNTGSGAGNNAGSGAVKAVSGRIVNAWSELVRDSVSGVVAWIAFGMVVAISAISPGVRGLAADEPAGPRCYLIGNSLTWDTVPNRMGSRVQWHVDCGVPLTAIYANPEKPCVKESRIWPEALRDERYDVVSVQPHYGTTLAQDVEVIDRWMKMQPTAVFVIHSGWAFHEKRADEFASYTQPTQMTHSPGYLRSLVAELRRLHPQREIRQTFAQNLLAVVAADIVVGRAPLKDVAELYRDSIHLTHSHGKYLAHNAMRHALGLPPSAQGFDNLDPDLKRYVDNVLRLLKVSRVDRERLAAIVADTPPGDATPMERVAAERAVLAAAISDADLRTKTQALLPEVTQALTRRAAIRQLVADVDAVGGKCTLSPSGPSWLYVALADEGVALLDVPTAIDLYNGNNPLKGKGGRNELVNDAWLAKLAQATTLKKLDLSNCAIQGEGLRHLRAIAGLRELSLTLTPVADAALEHLAGFTELRNLSLASTQCTGTGFSYLRGLSKLETVNFHFTPLNDTGLAAIAEVPIADRLWFAHTKFTDAGAAALAKQTRLKRCGIGSTNKDSSGESVAALVKAPIEDLALLDNQATAAGLAYAAKITTLKVLDASHAPTVTDASLPAIAALPQLAEFRLGSAQVTDQGLLALAASKSLKKITLSGLKQVTPDGVKRLREALPQCAIETR
jgi:hypothetical protein